MSIIGLDAKSLGLLKRGHSNDNPKYTAIKNEGGIILYALKPEHFNEADTEFLKDELKPANGIVQFDTRVFVGNVSVKGYKTHSDYVTETVEMCPITLINNPRTGRNPAEYAEALNTGEIEQVGEYAAMYLNYGTTIDPFTLDIRDLPNIDLNADASVSVTVGNINMSRPLQHLLNPARGIDPILTVTPSAQTMDGFRFIANFAGRENIGLYNTAYTHMAVIDGYKQYILQNANREEALQESITYQNATSVLGSVADFNLFGGIGSVLDALIQHGLRLAGFDDLRNQYTNLGGNIIVDALGEQFDTLVTVTYPLLKTVDTANNGLIYISEFAVNTPKTFTVNRTFPDIQTAINYIKTNYKGEIIGGDITPIIDYGDYTEYFKRIVNMGGLEWL